MVSSTDVLGDLARRDRESLLAIARELGVKVSSRSRKAEIIQAIEASSMARRSASDEGDRSLFANEDAAAAVLPPLPADDAQARDALSVVGSGPRERGQSSTRRRERRPQAESATEGTREPTLAEADRLAVDLARLLPPIAVDASVQRSDGSPGRGEASPAAARTEAHAESDGAPEASEQVRGEVARRGDEGSSRRSRRRRNKDRGDRPAEAEGPQVQELIEAVGVLDLRDEGYGFLRANGRLTSSRDTYVPASLVRKFGLRKGDQIVGQARASSQNEKFPALVRVERVFDMTVEDARRRPRFEDLTPLFPDERLVLENAEDPLELTTRIMDLVAPIGKGQRGLIVSPPKAGKTTVMKQIAHAIERNNPEVVLFVLLVDERPEEVTDIRRSVKGEVIASTFDRPAEEHTQVAELVIERAKRLVELGHDVVIILDGITRLARAYNLAQPASGRIMSGGVDSGALYPPKKFFGAARNVEEGGSLTILATALVETGSKMDEVIFEEFKGTGNMELRLDRRLAERRLFPAIDVNASSTRHEELLFTRDELAQVWKLRRVLGAISQEGTPAAGLELLIDKIRSTRSNAEFLAEIARSPGI
ncbi:transcription termination factor Rho [Acidimicrobium ferrooxidans DSM 10331]|uniref:Transcription termination factor Rho n=1 Tax=Acidimicrobium ferrooxidans (strain DSM 10331 / JCM 15462 / NBRC 103882 / ICP) TaxID=525909 RepID=C7M177_ACIFD|nr:transcription termination factor Rho [Acidimicrobium ferrooxidans]ACU54725.1 transcription termination factor Rho [Acidimicrobium ferrooxidans DSM 10331]